MKVRYVKRYDGHGLIDVFTVGKVYECVIENGQTIALQDDDGYRSVIYPPEYEVVEE